MAEKQEKKEQKGQGQQLQQRAPRAMRPFEDFERLYESFFPRSFMRPSFRWDWPLEAMPAVSAAARVPAIDVVDRENDILVRAEVPGVNKDDLDVSISDNTLTIRGSTKQETKEEKEEFYRQEMSYGEFSRQIVLPENIDSEKVKATMKNGVLELTLPKREGAKRKSIQVESS